MLTYQVTSSATDGYNAQTFHFDSLDEAETFAQSEAKTMGFAIVSYCDDRGRFGEISRFEGGMMRDTSCAEIGGAGNQVRANGHF